MGGDVNKQAAGGAGMTPRDAARSFARGHPMAWVLLLLCAPLLVWQGMPDNQVAMSQAVFLSAHSVLEIVSIVVSGLVFFVAYGTRETERSRRVVLLGCFFLATALFDTIHTLSYPGMPDIVSRNSADKMIWFWLAGRFSVGLGLLWYVLHPDDRATDVRERWRMVGMTLAAVAAVSYVVFAHEPSLPDMFVPGEGLTRLKIALEWMLCGLYLLVAVLFYRSRHDPASGYDATTLFHAMLLMAAGELFFTVYVQVSSTANLLGHVYKVIAYAYLYQAIFAEAVRAPFVRIAELNEAIRHEHDFVSGLIDIAPVIIILVDAQGVLQRANPYVSELSGHAPQDLLDRDWIDTLIPPRLQPEVRAAYFKTLQVGVRRKATYPMLTRSGEERQIEWSNQLVRDANGQITGLLGVGQDVTERQKAMEALQHSELVLKQLNETLEARVMSRTAEVRRQNQRNWNILSTALEGFYEVDAGGRIRDANPALCEMLGYSRDELLQMSLADIQAVESPDAVQAHIAKIFEKGFDRFDTRQRRKDGSLIDVEVSVSLVQLEGVQTFYAFQRDIGSRKSAQAALEAARDEAELANAAKSEFLSRMSHEFRTPLNAIIGFGQLLSSTAGVQRDPDQRDNVQEILQAGEHLLALVNEVLDLSRIESGKLELRCEPVDLDHAVRQAMAQVKPMAEQRGIRMSLEAPMADAVQADSLRLQEVLLNLLSNAIKYNRPDGRIGLSCRRVDAGVRVSVQDTGRGIAPAAMDRLFQPFERLESSYEGIEGTGIGLALTRRLVEAMDGRIGVESAPGQGSTFWFELPLASASPAPRPGPAASPALAPADMASKVLCIEDNPANLRLLKRILAMRPGLEFLGCADAGSGLLMAQQERPAVILLDINLPDVDGFEALRRLRADERTRAIPVIALTANAMPRDVERGMQAGFLAYLTKPLDVVRLLDVLDGALRHQTENGS
jgi:PAS domain S-box-containing protein